MSLETKFSSIKEIIENYNTRCQEKKLILNLIDSDEFIKKITLLGVVDESSLKHLSHEDLYECLAYFNRDSKVKQIKPVLLIKSIAKLLRGDEKEENKFLSKFNAERMSQKQLLENFDPYVENSIKQKLKELSNSKKFIIYDKDKKVNIEKSLYLLSEVIKGYPERNSYNTDEGIRQTYSVLEYPDSLVDENPIYVNRPLRPDNSCDQTNRSWDGIPLQVKQLIRLIVCKHFNKITLEQSHQLIDHCMSQNAFDYLSNRYMDSALEFQNLERINKLPSLKMELNKSCSGIQNFCGVKVKI